MAVNFSMLDTLSTPSETPDFDEFPPKYDRREQSAEMAFDQLALGLLSMHFLDGPSDNPLYPRQLLPVCRVSDLPLVHCARGQSLIPGNITRRTLYESTLRRSCFCHQTLEDCGVND